MTDNNTPEAVESQEVNESAEDSALVKDLRAQIKTLSNELKSVPKRADIEAELRASLAREKAIENELVGLNLPAGLSETVEAKLGGADVTREKVVEALTAIGFSISDESEGEAEGAEAAQQTADDLANVASLGSQVANAATTGPKDTLLDKINAANDPEELAAVMREAGMAQ